MGKTSNYPRGHQAKHRRPCSHPFSWDIREYPMFYKDPGFVSDWRGGAAIWVLPQELRVQGHSSCRQSSSFPLGALIPCQAPATCRGATPQSWHGHKQVETVRSHKRNIAEIQAAKITLQRLMFDPWSCFLELEPSPPLGDTTLCSRPHPRKAAGMQSSLGWKLKYFTPEEENSLLVLLFIIFF